MTKKHISNKELLFFGSYITYLVYYLMKQTAFTRGMPGFLDKLIPVICIAFLVLYEFYFGRMTHIECLELGVIACLALIQTKNSVGMTRNSFILLLIISSAFSSKRSPLVLMQRKSFGNSCPPCSLPLSCW